MSNELAEVIKRRSLELKQIAEHQIIILQLKILEKKIKKLEKKCKPNK